MDIGNFKKEFNRLFGEAPHVYRAPGRVNLIGEHTDYNDGFVFPAAIDLSTWVAVAPRSDRRIKARTASLNEEIEFDLDAPAQIQACHWSSYVLGVVQVLEQNGHRLRGANLLIHGDVPIGAGLSSSASLEAAVGWALLKASGIEIERRKLAQLCQKAENEYTGTRCGIMDQLASCCCVKGQALLLDCRSLAYRTLPLPERVRLVICNTMVRRELSRSAYNARRSECEEGVRVLAAKLPGVSALRDVTLDQLESCRKALPEVVYRRCRHVVTEDDRVLKAATALKQKQFDELRQAMAESHRSLREDYEVSCRELDTLVELAGESEGIYGARMTGAGFGGCTINLVHSDFVDAFRKKIAVGYERCTGLKPDIYVCDAADGVGSAF